MPKPMLFATDDEGRGYLYAVLLQASQTLRGLLKQALVGREAQKLLREASTRQGP